MTWRYCVTRTTIPGGHWYAIREVYFTPGDTKGVSWTVNEIAASGETTDDVRKDLERMLEALNLPILDISADPPVWIES